MLRVLIIFTYIFFILFQGSSAKAAEKTNGVCPCIVVALADTIPPAAAVAKKGILKKIRNFFKFRSNADARWVARVKRIIDTLGIVASISAEKDSLRRIRKLANNLTDSERIYYDTLLTLLNKIERSNAASSRGANGTSNEGQGQSGDSSALSPDMDDNMQALVNKIVARLPKTESPDTIMSSKAAYLARLSPIEISRTFYDTVGDTIRPFRVMLKKKLQIYGSHNASANAIYAGYRFDRISAVIYNSLTIAENGDIDKRGWDTARVIGDAEAAGAGLVASFMMQNRGKIRSFLSNSTARDHFIQSALPLLKLHKTIAANIVFDGLSADEALDFVSFIAELRNSPGFGDSLYKLFVTIPITDRANAFDLSALNKLTDNFIVSFIADQQHPPVGSGPVFPLSGGQENSIQTRISALTNAGVKRNKLIIGIPYFGAVWKLSAATGTGRFLKYLPYDDIRKKTGWKADVDPLTGAGFIDSAAIGGKGRDSIYRIWTDDENALGEKYDYALNRGLNGIAISTLGYDAGYGELWDELAYKLLAPDTMRLQYALLPLRSKPGFFGKLLDRLYLYCYIVQHPCERCFDNIQDSITSEKVYRYLEELNVDSLISAQERKDPSRQIHSRFQFINEEMRDLTIYITLGLLFITLLTGFVYFFAIKTAGDEWQWKKPVGTSLSICIVLTVLFAFTWAFCDKRIGLFGTVEKNLEESRYNGIIVTVKREKMLESSHYSNPFNTEVDYCDEALVRGRCVDISLLTFLSILVAGMIVGYIVNWLYHTVVHNEDNP